MVSPGSSIISPGHHVIEAVHAHDTVGNAGDGAFVARIGAEFELLDAMLDEFADF
jgi:hypothetical protein